MSHISRRSLLGSGLALSASSLAAHNAWSTVPTLSHIVADEIAISTETPSPRQQLLLDFGWKFTLGHGSAPAHDLGFGLGHGIFGDFAKTGFFEFAKTDYDDSRWDSIDLPHDWAIELPYVNDKTLRYAGYKPLGRSYPETSIGWYRKKFEIPAADRGRRITIELEGASRSALIFVNGCYAGCNDDGYTSFSLDITNFIHYGGKNCIAIRVSAELSAGWYYEGAGLYRHLWLLKTNPLHLGRWESTVRIKLNGDTAQLSLSTTAVNTTSQRSTASVLWQIFDADGTVVASAHSSEQTILPDGRSVWQGSAQLPNARLWSPDSPHLYTALVSLICEGTLRDRESISFGVRLIEFSSDRGFFLNGKPLKIQGTCNHQDHAGVGVALPDALYQFRLQRLREMGSNAVRTAHNMPAPAYVEACDRMGMMMMCETRCMNTCPEALTQLEEMVKRYRNSPSIILWSIGNEEEQLQGAMAEQGAMIAAAMVHKVHALDPTRPVSAAVNSNNEKGLSTALDLIGFNYQLPQPDIFHRKFPAWPLYGSETGGVICTRGEYTTSAEAHTASAYDVKTDAWNETAEEWWTFYATRAWQAGGFVWTGFDYRGEPAPYSWPSVNAQMGAMDLCGFPKDVFYYYKSWWQDKPVLHVLPHWNFTGHTGELLNVRVYSNLEEVELTVNGKSLGRKKVPHLSHLDWKVRYEPGVLEAVGYLGGHAILHTRRETTGPATALRITADRTTIHADGQDLALLTVEALDDNGRTIPKANLAVRIEVSGSGRLLGSGNGDPNCQIGDKSPIRPLFNGMAQYIVQAAADPGSIHVQAHPHDPSQRVLQPASITIEVRKNAAHFSLA